MRVQVRAAAVMMAAGSVSMIMMMLAAGCGGGGKGRVADEPGANDVKPLSLEADARTQAMTPEALAAQFEQDIADFQNLQRERTGGASPNEPFPTIAHRSDSGGVPRGEVVFEQPTRTASDDETHSGPLAMQETTVAIEPAPQSPDGAAPEARMREAMVNLRRELYQDASYSSEPLRQYLTMAALTLIDPDRAVDPDAFPDLREREREILRAYQNFFMELGRELHDSGDEAKLVTLIDQLRSALIEEPQLKIAQSQLCTRVDGFGSFEMFDKNVFLAGNAQDVVIYTEIEEFTSTQNSANEWVTDLWQELVIYNSHDNVPVWRQDWQAATDKSARKRTDFFISHLVTLPDRLTVGGYTLKVRVRDDATGIVAEAGIPFQIVADRSLTARAAQ